MNRDVMKEFGSFLFSILIWIDSLNLAKKKRWWCVYERGTFDKGERFSEEDKLFVFN